MVYGGNPSDHLAMPAGAFLVEMAQYGSFAGNMDAWESRTETPLRTSSTITHPVINFSDHPEGRFAPSPPFPLFGVVGNEQYMFLRASGRFAIADPGIRTFGLSSNGGFRVRIDGRRLQNPPVRGWIPTPFSRWI